MSTLSVVYIPKILEIPIHRNNIERRNQQNDSKCELPDKEFPGFRP